MLLLREGFVESDTLKHRWVDTGYRGKIHDVLYSLENRGWAERVAANYYVTGTQWRLTAAGREIRDKVQETLSSVRRLRYRGAPPS